MESATIDTEIEDQSRVSPPSYCDHLTASLYKIILHCNLNFTNMRRYEDFLSNEILGTHQRTLILPKIDVQFWSKLRENGVSRRLHRISMGGVAL